MLPKIGEQDLISGYASQSSASKTHQKQKYYFLVALVYEYLIYIFGPVYI